MLLFKQMLVLLLIMIVGFFAAKKGIIDQETNKKISSIVVNIANPAMILSGGMNSDMDAMQFFKILLLAVAIFAVLIILSYVIAFLLKVPPAQSGVYRCMVVFSNIGFMGIPLVHALYGDEAVLYASIFTIPFNILIYTFGIMQMGGENQKFEIKKAVNIGVLACLAAVCVTLFKLPVPDTIRSTMTYLGNLTSPLSMMVIGASFVQIRPKDLLCDIQLDIFMVVKMLVLPILGVLLLKSCGINGVLLGVSMVMIAAPVGSMNAMLSQQYGGDYITATKGVALSTVCAVLTMPVASLFL